MNRAAGQAQQVESAMALRRRMQEKGLDYDYRAGPSQ